MFLLNVSHEDELELEKNLCATFRKHFYFSKVSCISTDNNYTWKSLSYISSIVHCNLRSSFMCIMLINAYVLYLQCLLHLSMFSHFTVAVLTQISLHLSLHCHKNSFWFYSPNDMSHPVQSELFHKDIIKN